MKAHDWFISHRPDFAARALDPADEAVFREHLRRCTECRSEVEALEADLAWLPMGVRPAPLRPGFVRATVEHAVSPARRSRVWQLATAAAVLLAVGIWGIDQGRMARLGAALADGQVALAATRDSLRAAMRADQVLQASIEWEGRQGGMLILADDTQHRWKVVVHGIPAAPPGTRYTFWFVTGDGMVHGAEVICDERNPAVLMLDMPPGARAIRGGALTVEPMTGDPAVPRGRELAHLEM